MKARLNDSEKLKFPYNYTCILFKKLAVLIKPSSCHFTILYSNRKCIVNLLTVIFNHLCSAILYRKFGIQEELSKSF